MSYTHLKGLSITPDPRGSTALDVTGTVNISGALSLTNVVLTGTTRVGGIFSASASGKLSYVTKLDVAGTTRALGAFVQTGGVNHRVGSAANGVVGLKNIGVMSAGSGVVATTKVLGSSRILLTPIGVSGVGHRALSTSVPTIASGTSFKINFFRHQTAGTLATASGRVAWQIINK